MRRSWLVVVLVGAAVAAFFLLRGGGSDVTPARPREAATTYFLSHILFSKELRPPAESRRKAEQVFELISGGAAFAEVAHSNTDDDASRERGGYLGAVQTLLKPTALTGATQMLKEGETSPPVYTDLGWQVLHRHPYEEGRALDRRFWIPLYSVSITWRELHEGYDRSQEEALALAQRALADLQAGTITFTELRARHTRGGPGREDGWIGMFSRRPGTTGVFDALSAVPEGGLFGPYKDEGGFSVMRRGRFFRSVVRQILVKFREATTMEPGVTRMKAEAQVRAQEALAAARAHPERWAELVLKYSDDLDTRADEGSLGCISIGAMTEKRLEDAILDTPPGTIHPNLLESPLGFHIFYRVD